MSLESYAIIDSTLREGEQFINAQFSQQEKLRIAHALDDFGVEYLELTSPAASPGSADDVRAIRRQASEPASSLTSAVTGATLNLRLTRVWTASTS